MDSKGTGWDPLKHVSLNHAPGKKEYAHAFIYVSYAESTDIHRGRITSRTVQREQSQKLDGLCRRLGFTFMYDVDNNCIDFFLLVVSEVNIYGSPL